MLNYNQPKKDTMVKVYEFLNQILKDGATCYTNVYSGENEISELLENKMLNYFTFSYDGIHWFHITQGSWVYEVSMSIQYKPSREHGSGEQLDENIYNKTLADVKTLCEKYKHIGDRRGNIDPFKSYYAHNPKDSKMLKFDGENIKLYSMI